RSCVQVGPDCTCVKSRTRTPSSALPAWPQGLVDGRGRPFGARVFFAAAFLAFGFAIFAGAFAGAFVLLAILPLAFLAIYVSSISVSCPGRCAAPLGDALRAAGVG